MLQLRPRTLPIWTWFALIPLLLLLGSGAPPATRAAEGRWVTVQDGQLRYAGALVHLKGVSFYPSHGPWVYFWQHWDGPATRADLARIADFGGNTVRVLLPYRADQGIIEDSGAVKPVLLDRLRQLAQTAGELHLKLIITLFDWYDDTPATSDTRWQGNLTYLRSLAGAFADDDRVLGWDLHNEPDLYASWTDHQPAALDWLLRVGAELHRLAPHQLVTVGVAHAAALWQADPQGRTLLDVSDFAAFHSYDAGAINSEIAAIHAHTHKPVVLEETGWPTGPCGADPLFSDTQQVALYSGMVGAAEAGRLDGLLAWMLWDFPPTSSSGGGVESEQDHFGLLRLDGSLKPGAMVFRAGYRADVLPLDSTTVSTVPLTVAPPPSPVQHSADWLPPLVFPQTGHDLWDEFRDYWRRFGGVPIFGYPITEARFEAGRKVQYFERARFEYHPENVRLPGFADLAKGEKLRLLVQLTRLGAPLAAAQKFAPSPLSPEGDPPDVTRFSQTAHSLRGGFKAFWDRNAGLTNFGYPLSEERDEVSATDGKLYRVQYFERARFEWHPENVGTPYEVLLGQLGSEGLAARGCR